LIWHHLKWQALEKIRSLRLHFLFNCPRLEIYPEVLCSHKNPAKHFICAEHYDGKLARAYGLMIRQQLCQQIVVTVHDNGVPWQIEQ
jgi:hypothetical protein